MSPDSQPTQLPYVYFVSYSHAGRHGMGFGNTEISTEFPITTFEQVKEIGGMIADNGNLPRSTVVVTNYVLLRQRGADESGGRP